MVFIKLMTAYEVVDIAVKMLAKDGGEGVPSEEQLGEVVRCFEVAQRVINHKRMERAEEERAQMQAMFPDGYATDEAGRVVSIPGIPI